MSLTRRKFLAGTSGLGALSLVPSAPGMTLPPERDALLEKLDAAAAEPVLKRSLFPDPVILDSIELLRFEDSWLCRVRSTDGAEGWSVSNNMRMTFLYPIFLQRVAPMFKGRDARDLDALIEEVYRYRSNYKFQSYALWVPVATLEFAILDMLGRIAGKPLAELIGVFRNPAIKVWQKSRMRDKDAKTSVRLVRESLGDSGIKAIRFKIGEKMGGDEELIEGRTERLIPMAREEFGDDFWLGVDVNGGFGVERSIAIGKVLEASHYDFYEEPLPFDHYEELLEVSKALTIPLAGGEQDSSMRTCRWLIASGALDILRTDQFYFGGMIRSMQAARMAQVAGMTIVPHTSGSGLGFLYAFEFLSALENAGEYVPNTRAPELIPFECASSSLEVEDGAVKVPTGPGLGIEIDPDFIDKHRVVTES